MTEATSGRRRAGATVPGDAAPDAASRPRDGPTVPTPVAWTRVTKTLWPPQAGTLKFAARHAPRLVCVRYRQDPNGLCRYTTIELVVDKAWVQSAKARQRRVEVDIAFEETELRALARAQGARWDPDRRTWTMTGAAAQSLDLAHRAKPPRHK